MSLAQLDENVWIISEIYALNLLTQHELRMLEVGEFLRMALLFIIIHLKVPSTEGASKTVGKRNSNDFHTWIGAITEQIKKDKYFKYTISTENPSYDTASTTIFDPLLVPNSLSSSSSSLLPSSSSSSSSGFYYGTGGKVKAEPPPTSEYIPTPQHVPQSAIDVPSSTTDTSKAPFKPQERLQWNKNVEFNIPFSHRSQQRFNAKAKWSDSMQIYRDTLSTGISKNEMINRDIKYAFRGIHPKFTLESPHLREFMDKMYDNSMTRGHIGIMADYLIALQRIPRSKGQILPLVLSNIPKSERADPKFDENIVQSMRNVMEHAIKWSIMKYDRLQIPGVYNESYREELKVIFEPQELDSLYTSLDQDPDAERRVNDMCWQVAEHFMLADYQTCELLEQPIQIKCLLLVATLNHPDRMYTPKFFASVLMNYRKFAV